MKTTALIVTLFALVGLASCKSGHKTVIRPSANQEYRVNKEHVQKESGKADRQQNLGPGLSDVDRQMAKRLVDEAKTWVGTKYKYGGDSKHGTDCSGMLMTIFNDVAGLKLPRNSAAQQEYCVRIKRTQLQRGDLVFFSSSKGGSKVSHVGMYVGDGKMIHASTSRGVITSSLDEKYYATHYHSSGRVYGITYAGLGRKPSSVVTSAPVVDMEVDEMSLDDFINSQIPVVEKAETSVETKAVEVEMADTIVQPPTPIVQPQEPVKGAEPKIEPKAESKTEIKADPKAEPKNEPDSARRADEIRESVTRAMKFGK